MGKRKIEAREALAAIRSGMDDQALMARFHLSAKGLQSLLRKLTSVGAMTQSELDGRMPSFLGEAFISEDDPSPGQTSAAEQLQKKTPARSKRPPVEAREVLRDLHSGVSDGALMHKYHLSAKGLQHLLDQLVAAGLLGPSELEQRMVSFDTTVDVMEMIKQIGERTPSLGPDNRAQQTCPACGEPQTILFEECPACGVNLEQYRRKQHMEQRATHARWKCPACERPWDREFDECPVCGVIVSKFKDDDCGV